jgi:hypothetical protein
MDRRTFVVQLGVGCSALAGGKVAFAQANKVNPTDAQAAALGYVEDTTKVDAKKFPKHTKDQLCNNCQLFQGKAADAWGGCGLFPGKQVAGKGWCSAWVKKAG